MAKYKTNYTGTQIDSVIKDVLDNSSTWSSKQDEITDLDTIRSGAAAGATAVQDTNYVHTDNNYTIKEKTKLSGIEEGAEVNKVTDVTVDGTSVVNNKVANIDLTGKQNKLSITTSQANEALETVIEKSSSWDKMNVSITNDDGAVDLLQGEEVVPGETIKIYGVRRSLSTTSTGWVRTDDSVGLVAYATKAGSTYLSNFDSIYPWNEIKTVNYNVSEDAVAAEIGDANFKFDGTNGEVMTYIPGFYLKRWQDTENEYIQISKSQFDGAFLVHPFYIGRYTTSTGTHSISGVNSLVNQTISTFRTQAKALGDGWGQLDYHYYILEDLYLVEYADADSQKELGNGNCSTSAQIVNGGCDSLLMQSGCVTNDSKSAVIYRGVENPFGNIWQFVDGLNIKDNVAYICYDQTQYTSDKFTEPYQAIGYTNATSNGNPLTMGYDLANQLIALPKTVGTSTYGDYYWQSSGNRITIVGGAWNVGADNGFFCWYLYNDSSGSSAGRGARLLKLTV